MKSCRNCKHASHEGSQHRVALVCKAYAGTLCEATKSAKENKEIDERLAAVAADCPMYAPDDTLAHNETGYEVWYVLGSADEGRVPFMFANKMSAEIYARECFPDEDSEKRYARIYCRPVYNLTN